jgi:pre-rRNA-processing protein IPI1
MFLTDLCIKAIALPTQSITVEKDAKAPTTKRKLTFTDLVIHLKHHNSNVKKGILTDPPVSRRGYDGS